MLDSRSREILLGLLEKAQSNMIIDESGDEQDDYIVGGEFWPLNQGKVSRKRLNDLINMLESGRI